MLVVKMLNKGTHLSNGDTNWALVSSLSLFQPACRKTKIVIEYVIYPIP